MAKNEVDLGGVQWQEVSPDELRPGHTLKLGLVEDNSRGEERVIRDTTTVTRLDDGSIHMAFMGERNGTQYMGTHLFPAGTLRALVDYVDPSGDVQQPAPLPQRQPRMGWLGRILNGRRFAS